jgi:hypothetical protein
MQPQAETPKMTLVDEHEAARQRASRLERLFATPDRLAEAIIAAEVLAPPLALRLGSTAFDRRTF